MTDEKTNEKKTCRIAYHDAASDACFGVVTYCTECNARFYDWPLSSEGPAKYCMNCGREVVGND